MDHYIDISLIPDADMCESALMNLIYNKFHKALVSIKIDKIGVSFPGYQIKLGRVIRLHGDKANLNELQTVNWLGGIAGYCETSDLRAVPANIKYRTISRIRTNMSKSKLARLKRRGSITADKEKDYKEKMFTLGLTNPYFDLESGSTGQTHRRFIHFGSLVEQGVTGTFDSYGLSKCATIPWF